MIIDILPPMRSADPDVQLLTALADPVADVRWNAAVALARRRDPAAVPVLLSMMGRGELASVTGLTDEQRSEAMVQAVAAAAVYDDARLKEKVRVLRDGDPDLKVRHAATEAQPR